MHLKNYFKFSVVLFIVIGLFSCQATSTKVKGNDNSQKPIEFSDPTKIDENLIEVFVHTQPNFDFTKASKDSKVRPYVKHRTRSSIWTRLRAGLRFRESTHPRVLAEIRWFKNNPDYLERVYDRAEPVLHYVLEQVEKRGIPTELALLPVVESAFQPFAYSHAAASGIWQFIPSTGRIYGLRQDWWYDGRRDLVGSTRASLAYLTKLTKLFKGDWMLALASYNSGEGRVGRAVRRNRRLRRSTSYWHLKLPRETRAYVPKLLAITAIIKNSKKYGLTLREIPDEPQFKSVFIGHQIDLAIAAELAGISLEEMYKLNPGFNRWATSPKGPHRLLIPIEVADDFKAKISKLAPEELLSWKDYKVSRSQSLTSLARKFKITVALIRNINQLKGNRVKAGQTIRIPVSYIDRKAYKLSLTQRIKGSERLSSPSSRKGRRIRYRVRRGDTLYRIARRYRVSRTRLAKWNGLSRRARLRRGQRLTIYKSRRSASISRFKARYRKRAQSRSKSKSTIRRSSRRITYVVRRGDTLFRISKRYRVSLAQIKRWNRGKIGRRGYIYPGLRLRIHKTRRRR